MHLTEQSGGVRIAADIRKSYLFGRLKACLAVLRILSSVSEHSSIIDELATILALRATSASIGWTLRQHTSFDVNF